MWGDGLSRGLFVPGTMCRDIQILWLAVMLVFEYDRECSAPRCCRGQSSGQAFECFAFGEPKALHSERLGVICGGIRHGVPRGERNRASRMVRRSSAGRSRSSGLRQKSGVGRQGRSGVSAAEF